MLPAFGENETCLATSLTLFKRHSHQASIAYIRFDEGWAVEITDTRNLVKVQTLRSMRRLYLGLMPLKKGIVRLADSREVVL